MADTYTDGKGNYVTWNGSDWVPTSPPPEKESGTAPEAVGDTLVSPADVARVNAPPANPPITSLSDLRDRIQQGDISTLKTLAPGPEAGPIERGARYAAMTGVHGLASLVQWPINALMGVGQGTGGLTINPATNTLGQTPESLTAASLFASPLRFSGSGPANRFVPPGSLERKPLSADATALSPDAEVRIRATHGGPVPVAQPTVPTPFNTPPTTAVTGVSAEAAAAQAQAKPMSLPTGVPLNQMAPSIAADGTLMPPGLPGEPTPHAVSTVPVTSDAAREVASAYYKRFDKAAQDGGSLNPQATDRFIGSVEAAAPPPGIGQAVAGKNAITDLVERLQDYKGKPMSLQDAHVVDQQLGHLITAEYGRTGVSSIGRQLQDIQQKFRDQLSNPEAGDVVSGQAGLDALAPARKAYSQAMKLDTIERIQERAQATDNPTTSFRTQIRTLLSNDKLSRGFSEEEKAALKDAANRGVAGSALHLMGSRLIPIISGSTGGGVFGAAVGYGLNEAARAGAGALAAKRLQNAYTILGKSVPPAP